VRRFILIASLLLIPVASGPVRSSDSVESRYLSNIRQITTPSQFVRAGEGYFSPDAQTIVFQAITAGYPFYQIYTKSMPGGEPKLLSTGRGRTTCSYFSPDGQRILFASSHLDPALEHTEAVARKQQEEDRRSGRRRRYQWDFDPHMDIFVADRKGNLLDRLTRAPGYDAEGAFGPRGKTIAFCSDRDGDPDLYVMDADGSNLRQLTDIPGYDGGPFISPDGKWIVYRSDRLREDYLQIHVISIDGKQDVALTDNVGVNWGPYWHPNMRHIIWSGADHSDPEARPNYDLHLMEFEIVEGKFRGGATTRITDNAAADVLPVFSPDGRQLMWTSTRTADASSQLYLADFTLP
jgi:Tol biopolymer transport system component